MHMSDLHARVGAESVKPQTCTSIVESYPSVAPQEGLALHQLRAQRVGELDFYVSLRRSLGRMISSVPIPAQGNLFMNNFGGFNVPSSLRASCLKC